MRTLRRRITVSTLRRMSISEDITKKKITVRTMRIMSNSEDIEQKE